MTRYLLVLPIVSFKPMGESYAPEKLLPLHCTVMPWFSVERLSFEKLCEGIAEVVKATQFAHIELISEAPTLLGPRDDVPAHTLRHNNSLQVLHLRLLQFLSRARAVHTDIHWVGEGWRPHVTTTDHAFLPGRRHVPKWLITIERGEKGFKKIVHAQRLG